MRTPLKTLLAFTVVGWILGSAPNLALAAPKVFSGAGDGSTWHLDKNWSAEGIPSATDAVTIDLPAASVITQKDFVAQSVTVGGKTTSTWSVEPFVFGTITPPSTSDPAISIRKGGTVFLKGAGGKVVVKGSLKSSREALPSEPSVMILLQ